MHYRGPIHADFGACPYLPNRHWTSLLMRVEEADDHELAHLMELGFRRLGSEYYVPICRGCAACISLRIPVQTFRPNKNQRQIWKRNQDIELTVAPASFSEEKYQLYASYQQQRWKKDAVMGPEEFQRSYLGQPGQGLEFCYRLDSRLVGCGWVDVTHSGLSSVYFVWDCDPKRSLGIYSVLCEIDWCQRHGRDFVYLGLYVEGCDSMRYKASFQPHQRRYRDANWIDLPEGGWPSLESLQTGTRPRRNPSATH